MRDYGKLNTQFWLGSTGKALRGYPCAQVVAVYLVSSPHSNMLGLYYLPLAFLVHETGLGIEAASEGLQRCIEAGFCSYDPDSEMVWIHRMAEVQIAEALNERDKRVKGIHRLLESLPTNPFTEAFVDCYKEAFFLHPYLATGRGIEGPSERHASQEQGQEQGQNQDHDQHQNQSRNPSSSTGGVVGSQSLRKGQHAINLRIPRRKGLLNIEPFPEEVKKVVNVLMGDWPNHQPGDGAPVAIRVPEFGQCISDILRDHPDVSPEMLIEAGQEYLGSIQKWVKAPQSFFAREGEARDGSDPLWMTYVRAVVTKTRPEGREK